MRWSVHDVSAILPIVSTCIALLCVCVACLSTNSTVVVLNACTQEAPRVGRTETRVEKKAKPDVPTLHPWLSAEEAVEIYATHHERGPWCGGNSDLWLVFVDLDFDGVLEAVVNECAGSAHYCGMYAHRIDPSTKLVEQIVMTHGKNDTCIPSCAFGTNSRLLRDKDRELKEYHITGSCYNVFSPAFYAEGDIRLTMENGVLKFDSLADTCDVEIDGLESFEKRYSWESQRVSKNDFDRLWREYESKHIDLHVKIASLSGDDLRLTGKALREKMLVAYRVFSYDREVSEK